MPHLWGGSVSSRSQHSGSVGSPDSRNDAEEASSSPSSSGVSIPLAFRGQRNPLLEKADQLLAGLRARVHPTPDKRMGVSASSQHTCTTPKDNTASTEVQSSSSLTGPRLGSLVWNDADAEARSSGGGEGMCTPPPIEGIESLGDDRCLEILLPPPPGFSGEGSMDTFPEETSPGRQEEEMIQRGRHGVDPEFRDYINGGPNQGHHRANQSFKYRGSPPVNCIWVTTENKSSPQSS